MVLVNNLPWAKYPKPGSGSLLFETFIFKMSLEVFGHVGVGSSAHVMPFLTIHSLLKLLRNPGQECSVPHAKHLLVLGFMGSKHILAKVNLDGELLERKVASLQNRSGN